MADEEVDSNSEDESEDEMEEEIVSEGTAKKTKNSDLMMMMMMKEMMMKNDAHQKTQNSFSNKVDKSMKELSTGLKRYKAMYRSSQKR